MEPLNVQPQTLPLDLSAYGFTPPLLSLPVIHPALLSSIVDMQNANSKYLSIDPGESGKFSQPESNNNETAPPQVSSSRSDSDSTVSPAAPRHNVIVKNHSKRKKELVKDSAYWERRRKNNDAAKKSRDSRRQKEDDMACRAATLEQENIKLRAELEQLKNETGHLRALMLHAPVKVPLSLHHPIGSTSLHTNISMIAAPSVITTTDFCGSLPHLPFTGPPRNTVLVNNLKT